VKKSDIQSAVYGGTSREVPLFSFVQEAGWRRSLAPQAQGLGSFAPQAPRLRRGLRPRTNQKPAQSDRKVQA